MPYNLEIYDNDDYNQLELADFRTMRRGNKPNLGELKDEHENILNDFAGNDCDEFVDPSNDMIKVDLVHKPFITDL